MATFNVRLVGKDRLTKKLKRLRISDLNAVQRSVALAGAEVQNRIKNKIARGPHVPGVTTIIGGKSHTRSGEGGPPKTDTGFLVNSIRFLLDEDRLGVSIGSRAPYAARLEFGFHGTDSKGRNIDQGARPFIHPSFEELKKRITERVRAAIRASHRKVAR